MQVGQILKWVFVSLWIAIILTAIIVEIITIKIFGGLVAISAFFGLLIAILWGEKTWTIIIQIGVAFALWVISYFFIYKILKNFINKKIGRYDGSIEDYIGREFELLRDSYEKTQVEYPYGQIKIQDKVFRTLSNKNQGHIKKGSLIIITKLEGNTFYIKKLRKKGEK